jgi:hypothetical protein
MTSHNTEGFAADVGSPVSERVHAGASAGVEAGARGGGFKAPGTLYFSNPASPTTREDMVVLSSTDGGMRWSKRDDRTSGR